MELLRKLGTRVSKSGYLESWGIFKCPNILCNKEVERHLNSGKKAKSCGCLRYEITNTKHDETGIKLYIVWANMKQRILNSNNKDYEDYGGRGITICPEWENDYVIFRDWALSNGYKEGLQINRINNNGNYEPSNCNFVTHKENQKNRRTKLTLEKDNEIRYLYSTGNYTYKELAKKYGVSISTIYKIIFVKVTNL